MRGMGPPFFFRGGAGAPAPGYTLAELVTVIALIGIIAAFAAPRFFDRTAFDERGFFELSLQSVRYAQKLAQSSGCDTRVTFSPAGIAVHQWISGGSCAANACAGGGLVPVPRPGGGDFVFAPPPGVGVGTRTYCFDPIGRPRVGGGTSVTVGGRTLTVENETGFARCTAGC